MNVRHSAFAVASARASEEISRAIGHMHDVVLNGATSCECHEQLHEALRHLERSERDLIAQRLLHSADKQRRKIEALLVLLGDFDPNGPAALDDGVVAEASLLFGDIAAAAELGSSLLRQAREFRSAPAVQEEAEGAICGAVLTE